jgi:hypothetical protein
MAYTIAIGDIFEVQAVGVLDDQTTRNTFHYAVALNDPGEAGPDALQDIGQTFYDQVWVNIQSNMSHEWALKHISVQKIWPVRYRPDHLAPADIAADETGGDVNDALPSGAAVVLSRFAEKSDPEYQGRIYIPAIPVNHVDGSKVLLANLPAYEANAALLAFVLEPVAGFKLIPTLTVEGDFSVSADHQIKGSACDGIVRYQRRREVGRGE